MCLVYYYYCYTGCAHTLCAYAVPSADHKIYQRCAASLSGRSAASLYSSAYSSAPSCSAGTTYYSPSTASLSTATCYKMCAACERATKSKANAPTASSTTTPSYNTSPSTISALLRDTTPPLNIDAWLSKTVGTTATGSFAYKPSLSSPLAGPALTVTPAKRAAESTLTFTASKPPMKKRGI